MDYSKVCGTDCEVGEEFYYKGIKLKALELKSKFEFQCESCYFYNNNCEMIGCRSSEREDRKCVRFVKIEEVGENNGGSTDYYKLPAGATELQDLIEYKDMRFSVANIFKAAYRLGNCKHSDKERDLNKIIWFAKREIERMKKESR